jgi:hypothetical protein
MVKMQEKRKVPGRFSQAVAPPQNIFALNLSARDDEGVEPPSESKGVDSAVIRIVLADAENIHRVSIQKIFAHEDDIRVIAQAGRKRPVAFANLCQFAPR